jgi:lantibiotic modifying enzyme
VFSPQAGADLANEKIAMQSAAAEDVLRLAEDIGAWLTAIAIRGPDGLSWPDDALQPDVVSCDLAAGVAGKVLYFAALHEATGNSSYLNTALDAADFLIACLDNPSSFADNLRRASLYRGISGMGVALMHVQQHSSKYQDAVLRIVDRLQEWSTVTPEGMYWSDDFNDLIYGDAGTALFLAYVADRTGNSKALSMSRNGARFLLHQEQQSENASFWLFRRSKSFNLPNFSHGTAGVSYVLATVGSVAGQPELLAGAARGFRYIQSIANVENGMLRIPYGWGSDSWDGLYEFGWAHGLAGTTALFQRLQLADIETEAAAEFEELARYTLLNIGLPGTAVEPFAEPSTPLDRRFGRAGILAILADWSKNNPDNNELITLREELFRHLERAAVRDNRGARWEVDAPAFMGGSRAAYTGTFHGAAGIGLALLRLHASMLRRDAYIRLPDDPFAW